MSYSDKVREYRTDYRVASEQKAQLEAKQAAEIASIEAKYVADIRELTVTIMEAEYELKKLRDIADYASMRKNTI